MKNVSIIIRTLNEQQFLPKLLRSIEKQDFEGNIEVIIVDSGSTDDTLSIAKRFHAQIFHIKKENFSFGGSLNLGCLKAKNDILVFVSGHCIPVNNKWLKSLVKNINKETPYVYGQQIGNHLNFFSETQIFKKYFPDKKSAAITYYINNANSALLRSVWKKYKFDENLTGLEDLDVAKRIIADGYKLSYEPDARIFHIHQEKFKQIKNRFERESLALQKIMPEVHINIFDLIVLICSSVIADITALDKKRLRTIVSIIAYRCLQYYGSYRGNHISRRLSKKAKYVYFYPK